MSLPTQFAKTPADAVQLLCDLGLTAQRIRTAYVQGDEKVRQVLSSSAWGCLADNENDWLDLQNVIRNVPVFLWDRQIGQMVLEASRTYPIDDEQRVHLADVKTALVTKTDIPKPGYFPKQPIGIACFTGPVLDALFETEGRQPMSALMWRTGFSVRTGEGLVGLYGLSWAGSICAPIWVNTGGFSRETNVGTFGDGFADERMAFIKWVCAASMFMEQEIVDSPPEPVGRRTRERTLQQIGRDIPHCNVVKLRRVRHEGSVKTDPGGEHVEWSCQWLVRGHWRRQWFAKRNAHAPMWIHPHLKGPDDKPLKAPSPTVFSVGR